ncbi:ATP-dependent DNA helicase [Candidatus Bathyarchaeota archaeon]|jgi:ATP-dependent DNA helicase DinG|nr:ATP-dependent DNA helicase [Candidatus Bathyarchaeota archaeon]
MTAEFDFKGFFPYPTVRPEQTRAINFALDAFYNQGKRFVIIEAGTGTGKSGIGLSISRYMNAHRLPPHPTTVETARAKEQAPEVDKGTWFLTTQKILQDQYVKDFGAPAGWMRSVKSSSNYQCSRKKGNSCAESRQLLKGEPEGSAFKRACNGGGCVYVQARTAWAESAESVTNFPYFMTLGNFANGVKTRRLLVVDEAHNIEGELSKFIDVSVTETFAKRVLKLDVPRDLRTQHQVVRWIRDTYFPKVKSHLDNVKKIMTKFKGLKDKLSKIASIARQMDLLNGHHDKIEKFLKVYDKENWVMNIVKGDGRAQRKFEFKVIDVAPFSESNLFRFGDRVLLMSATILNAKAYCESLGIPADQVATLEISTPFPIENRPILYAPSGRMSRAHINDTLPKMAETIKMLMEHHKDEKGIIHTHTFRIANFLRENIRSSRILVHDSANREDVLQNHLDSKKPTILLSPSMTEGVDLKGDSSRFQIVCKIPYPYLGDPLTKKRMNRWPWWYGLQTAKTIVQGVGRSVRSIDDHAVTYILDEDWHYFYGRNREMFPTSFKDALS